MQKNLVFKKNYGLNKFRFRKKLGFKKLGLEKNCGSVKFWIPKKIQVRKNLGSTNIWVRKYFDWKKFGVEKILVFKIFELKKIWGPKI